MAQARLATRVATFICALLLCPTMAQAADSQLQIVSFTSAGCQPCKSMQPVLEKLAREGWQIRQVDVQEHPELIKPFNVTSLPTIVMLQDRREVDRIVGTLGYEKLLARFEDATQTAATPIKAANPNELLELVGPANTNVRPAAASRSDAGSMAVRGQSPAEMTQFNPPAAPKALTAAAPLRAGLSSDDRAQRATVRIKIEDANSIAYGTGTVINMHGNQALVLTCGHIFRGIGRDAQLSVDVFDNGRTTNVPAQAVSYSHEPKQADIGLIEFRSPFHIEPVPIADAQVMPAVGEPAFSFGCDQGADPTRRETQIKQLNRYIGPDNIEIAGAPVVGRSGGGLFNARGQLIGVCNCADNEDDEGIYASLPVIHRYVAALKLETLPKDPVNAPASALVDAPIDNTPMQLASATGASNAPADYWPDQKFAAGAPAPGAAMASVAAAAQVQCVIRDASGKETTVTIDRPSQELLAMLKSQGR